MVPDGAVDRTSRHRKDRCEEEHGERGDHHTFHERATFEYAESEIRVGGYRHGNGHERLRVSTATDYTPEEEEEFREVLYTTLAREVEEWVQSLESRGITLPVAVREEALLIIGEQRFGS